MADELDTTLLIAEVHKRPMLYSKADQDYLNKAKKDQTWERIATKFGTSAKNVRTKWSYLRDKFVKELRRSSALDGGKVTSWPHFKSMMFVRDSSKRKGSAANSSSSHHSASAAAVPAKVDRPAALAATAAMHAAATAAAAAAAAAANSSSATASSSDPHAAEPNVKRLIAEIRKRPLLYSRDDPDYQNKQRKDECWQDIYQAMDGLLSVKQMKSKWTYLRDKLVKELKKNSRTLRKAEGSRWMYFDSMAFVRDANRHYIDANDVSASYGQAAAGGSSRSHHERIEIDVDLLITEILKRPVLYDEHDEKYRDHRIRNRAWEEIASLLGDSVTIEEVQQKWSNLRERFAKELLRTSRAANRGVRVRRRWEHFDKMMLLNECVNNSLEVEFHNNSISSSQQHTPAQQLPPPASGTASQSHGLHPQRHATSTRNMKYESPVMFELDADPNTTNYLNAAYLCADFGHTNGGGGGGSSIDQCDNNNGIMHGDADEDDVPEDDDDDEDAFPTPIAVLSPSPVDDVVAGQQQHQQQQQQHHLHHHQQQQHIADDRPAGSGNVEGALLRLLDIISNVVLTKTHAAPDSTPTTASTSTAGSAAAPCQSQSVVPTSSSGSSSSAVPRTEDKYGNEPFLEYVRHYLRHTTLANNMELKRLVTQFMHSNPSTETGSDSNNGTGGISGEGNNGAGD